MELSLSRERISQLLAGEEVYEIISGFAYNYRLNSTYPLYKIPNTYVKVLGNGMFNCKRIPSYVWDSIKPVASKQEYISERCGPIAWELNSRVYVLKLVMTDEPHNKRLRENKMRKAWIRGNATRGLFLCKDFSFPIDCEIAISEPYCYASDRLGEEYREMLCKAYGITLDELLKLSAWTNRSHTIGHLLPRRVKVVGSKICRVRDISEEDWELLGVGASEIDRKNVVGASHWDNNLSIGLYEYELVTNNAFSNGK